MYSVYVWSSNYDYLVWFLLIVGFGILGLTHILTIDLHHKEIQGFFDIPVDNLRASAFIMQYIREQVCLLYMIHYHVWYAS